MRCVLRAGVGVEVVFALIVRTAMSFDKHHAEMDRPP